MKITGKAKILWEKRYGTPKNENGYWMERTNDNNYIIAGSSNNYNTSLDIYLLKISPNGDSLWDNHFTAGGNDVAHCIRQDANGNFVIFGRKNDDALVAKTDADGHFQWYRTYNGNDKDDGEIGLITPDGGYLLVGYLNNKFFAAKTDTAGNTLWEYTYGNSGDHAYEVSLTNDGDFILAGRNGDQLVVMKIDAGGTLVWNKILNNDGFARCMTATHDGNFVIAGYTDSDFLDDQNAYIAKITPTGKLLWDYEYGKDKRAESVRSIIRTRDNGFIMAGASQTESDEDIFINRVTKNGNPGW